ncbi:hypothetical protein C0Q70_11218 [Pomacea canaliculata]|uniref:Uncharacterized protein n=1 Tax=Pomacea canaliculata TaxID=400727 RepID=A0A2T7P5C0_POMCA|nr:hypothetical protein C0Q70_11218 [Pomacea canaliculata]
MSVCSYLTPQEEKKKHHIQVVEKEIRTHPELYPELHPKAHPSEVDQEKEVGEFDSKYQLKKEPEPHIKPSL